MKFLCWLGFHRHQVVEEKFPSFGGEVVMTSIQCARCGGLMLVLRTRRAP